LTDATLIPLGDKGFSLLVAYAPNFALSVLRVLAKHLRAVDAKTSTRVRQSFT